MTMATFGATWRGVRTLAPPTGSNVWGLRTPNQNQEDGRQMVTQQVNNILRLLEKANKIPKHLVTEDLLPKGK